MSSIEQWALEPVTMKKGEFLALIAERDSLRAAIRALDLSQHGGCESCARVRQEHAQAISAAWLDQPKAAP